MKISKIQFNNHKILGNLEISFQNENKKILDTIVLIGENGTGKTTILKEIYDLMDIENSCKSKNKIFLELNNDEKNRLENFLVKKIDNIIM